MRAHQRALQLGAHLGRDVPGGQGAEPGRDAVRRGGRGGELLDHGPGADDRREGLVAEPDRGAVPGDRDHLGEGQGPDADLDRGRVGAGVRGGEGGGHGSQSTPGRRPRPAAYAPTCLGCETPREARRRCPRPWHDDRAPTPPGDPMPLRPLLVLLVALVLAASTGCEAPLKPASKQAEEQSASAPSPTASASSAAPTPTRTPTARQAPEPRATRSITVPKLPRTPQYSGAVLGADISWPQCPKGMGIPQKQGQGSPRPGRRGALRDPGADQRSGLLPQPLPGRPGRVREEPRPAGGGVLRDQHAAGRRPRAGTAARAPSTAAPGSAR